MKTSARLSGLPSVKIEFPHNNPPTEKMKLDRAYQLQVLQYLADAEPRYIGIEEWMQKQDPEKFASTLLYLEGHGLVESNLLITESVRRLIHFNGFPKITSKGRDFIEQDGGLSAILGVVTIKFHEDTIRDLIASKITKSDLPPAEKRKWLDSLRELPADSIRHLTMTLLDKGLEYLPTAIRLIGTYLDVPT